MALVFPKVLKVSNVAMGKFQSFSRSQAPTATPVAMLSAGWTARLQTYACFPSARRSASAQLNENRVAARNSHALAVVWACAHDCGESSYSVLGNVVRRWLTADHEWREMVSVLRAAGPEHDDLCKTAIDAYACYLESHPQALWTLALELQPALESTPAMALKCVA